MCGWSLGVKRRQALRHENHENLESAPPHSVSAPGFNHQLSASLPAAKASFFTLATQGWKRRQQTDLKRCPGTCSYFVDKISKAALANNYYYLDLCHSLVAVRCGHEADTHPLMRRVGSP
jgi:hypothetical protein